MTRLSFVLVFILHRVHGIVVGILNSAIVGSD